MENQKTHLISGVILTIAALSQIAGVIFLENPHSNDLIRRTGLFIMCLSAIFGWLPMFTLKRRGGVPAGKSYMQTTRLVQSGIYKIVRHPQYLAGILMGIGLSLISQQWLVALPGIVVIGLSYAATFVEERQLVEKFPGEYEEYQKRVPRVNFIAGILRLLFQKI